MVYRWWPWKGAVVLKAVDDAALTSAAFPDTGDIEADLRAQMAEVADILAASRTGPALVGLIAEPARPAAGPPCAAVGGATAHRGVAVGQAAN
jgi:hypothetical protein